VSKRLRHTIVELRALPGKGTQQLLLAHIVEHLRGQGEQATPGQVAYRVASRRQQDDPAAAFQLHQLIARQLEDLAKRGMVQRFGDGYVLTQLGADVLLEEMEGWVPVVGEQLRRDRNKMRVL
jgi:hypothetical protein